MANTSSRGSESSHPAVAIRALSSSSDLRECAMIMASSEPWITLGRTYDDSLALLSRSDREVYGAFAKDELLGFVVIVMTGAFVGYVQTVAVRAADRSRGVGSALVTFAEERIWRESPNVFMCVSSFNPRARALYERMGYRVVGELESFVVTGHSEILLRKTLGPIREWTPPARKN